MKKEGMKMALKALSKEMHGMMGEDYKGGLEEALKPKKKLMSVQVAADSKENLKKGLSNAEKLLKAKSDLPMSEDEESEPSCEECEGKGCNLCESEEEESNEEYPSEDELKNMSKEELLSLLLKKEDSDKE